MTSRFPIHLPPNTAYVRDASFAVEVLDGVTLNRVRRVKVTAVGLKHEPIVNAGGLFVWLKTDLARLERIVVDPADLPYQAAEIPASRVAAGGVVPVELAPRADYPFPGSTGVTGLRGRLVESRVPAPIPVAGAEVHLRWLHEDGVTWLDAPTTARTTVEGDFIAIARLSPADAPRLDAGALTVRLRASRGGGGERESADIRLPEARVADPWTFDPARPDALTFAWDELQ